MDMHDGKPAWKRIKDMQQEMQREIKHAAWTCSREMQYQHAAFICSYDMEH
jgi:hypothetical protein